MALHSVSRRRQQILHARAAPKVTLALLEVMDRPLLPFISWANEGGRQREAAIAFAVVYRPLQSLHYRAKIGGKSMHPTEGYASIRIQRL